MVGKSCFGRLVSNTSSKQANMYPDLQGQQQPLNPNT